MLGITAARLRMSLAQTRRRSPSTTQVLGPQASLKSLSPLPSSLLPILKYLLNVYYVPGPGDTVVNTWSLPGGGLIF